MNKKLLMNLKNSQQITICMALTFIIAIVIWNSDQNEVVLSGHRPIENIDTKIPFGHTIEPITISNKASVDALVGDFAVVNLYQTFTNKKTKLVLQRIKLVRSPKDRRYFGALMTMSEAEIFSQYPGPFKVSLQNPNKPNKIITKKVKKQKRQIIVEDEK